MALGREGKRESRVDVYERAAVIWNEGIDHPTFIAELDQDAMKLRAECARTGTPLTLVAEAIFCAADEDPDRWAHAEVVAAWALRDRPSMEGLQRSRPQSRDRPPP
jgi:hypothetical protein